MSGEQSSDIQGQGSQKASSSKKGLWLKGDGRHGECPSFVVVCIFRRGWAVDDSLQKDM